MKFSLYPRQNSRMGWIGLSGNSTGKAGLPEELPEGYCGEIFWGLC